MMGTEIEILVCGAGARRRDGGKRRAAVPCRAVNRNSDRNNNRNNSPPA